MYGLLGQARAGVAKSTEDWEAAEADLLSGRETFAGLRGPKDKQARDFTQALVELYTAWALAEPGAGHETKAAEWQQVVDEHQ